MTGVDNRMPHPTSLSTVVAISHAEPGLQSVRATLISKKLFHVSIPEVFFPVLSGGSSSTSTLSSVESLCSRSVLCMTKAQGSYQQSTKTLSVEDVFHASTKPDLSPHALSKIWET